MDYLPAEVLELILQHLSLKDRLSVYGTCRKLRQRMGIELRSHVFVHLPDEAYVTGAQIARVHRNRALTYGDYLWKAINTTSFRRLRVERFDETTTLLSFVKHWKHIEEIIFENSCTWGFTKCPNIDSYTSLTKLTIKGETSVVDLDFLAKMPNLQELNVRFGPRATFISRHFNLIASHTNLRRADLAVYTLAVKIDWPEGTDKSSLQHLTIRTSGILHFFAGDFCIIAGLGPRLESLTLGYMDVEVTPSPSHGRLNALQVCSIDVRKLATFNNLRKLCYMTVESNEPLSVALTNTLECLLLPYENCPFFIETLKGYTALKLLGIRLSHDLDLAHLPASVKIIIVFGDDMETSFNFAMRAPTVKIIIFHKKSVKTDHHIYLPDQRHYTYDFDLSQFDYAKCLAAYQ